MRFPFQLLAANDFDVVGFGTNAVDYLIRVPEYPSFNSKVELTDYSQAAGGEVASTMAGLQRLGFKTAYAGRFGSDPAGDIGLRSLRDEGVDIGYAEIVDGAQTQVAFIVIDQRSGERTVIWKRDDQLAYSASEAPVKAAARGRVLHMTQHDAGACIEMAKTAKAAGAIVSMDIDNVFDGMDELLPLVDICIASAEFAGRLFGTMDTADALREIDSRYGCVVTGLTLGAAGSVFICDGTIIETRGMDVPGGAVDTTGAGDAFRTGFLSGLLNGESIESSAVRANAVAALKCRGLGARSTLPTGEELAEFLKGIRV